MIEQHGVHRLRCGDAAWAVTELLAGQRAQIFYSDPAWGPGMMTFFQTKHEEATGQPAVARDYRDLLRDLAQQASQYTDGPVFIEYGMRWKDEVTSICRDAGLRPVTVIACPYGGGQFHLHVFSTPTTPVSLAPVQAPEYAQRLQKVKGARLVAEAIAPFAVPDGILVDPCCGLGLMAKAAKKHGMRFYGNELNPSRLARTREVVR